MVFDILRSVCKHVVLSCVITVDSKIASGLLTAPATESDLVYIKVNKFMTSKRAHIVQFATRTGERNIRVPPKLWRGP